MRTRISPSQLRDLTPRRICVIKPSALGDIVQALPLLHVLKERYSRAKISWVVNSHLADLLVGHPRLNQVLKFHRNGTWRDWRSFASQLRAAEFDLVFDLQGLLRTGVMTWATRAPVRVGLETAREGSEWACNCILPETGRLVPAHQRYWRVAEVLGLGERQPETTVAIPNGDRAWAQKFLSRFTRPILAVQPGARWMTKRYPPEKFAAVTARAIRQLKFSVVVLGSGGERPLAEHLTQLLQRTVPSESVYNLAGQTSLKQLAALLSQVDCVLTNDSGPMHLAAGVGTPVVGVFTCTSPTRSGPPGPQHELVSTRIACAASYHKQCPYSGTLHMGCIEQLHVDEVWQALLRVVQRNRLLRPAA